MNWKKLIVVFLIISWCGVIFYASSRTSDESNSASKRLVYNGLSITLKITNKLKITDIELTESNYKIIVDKLNYPLRKCAHATVYFILAILIFIFLKLVGLKRGLAFLIAIIFCFIFSLTDEYHQTFVDERTGQFSDCLIDTTGSIIGAGILCLFSKKKQ
ncbi:MAG: VanZ family protein [Bacilli bacterium]|nr:VanZ family protein [Bacilli bacterium]